jgi:uncharacterized membrane protein YhaH (DUF805 family)
MRKETNALSLFNASDLTEDVLYGIARKTRFVQRASGMIPVAKLLECICEASAEGTVSYNDLAARVHAVTGVRVSRQAYWERINTDYCVAFFKTVLAKIMVQKLHQDGLVDLKNCTLFKRILIHDSTIIKLPTKLYSIFSGVSNISTTVCNARIQGVYDLCSGQFISFSIDPYSKNDLSVAHQIEAQPGDLVLRDRGYFLIEAIGELKKGGVDTISRYKHPTVLYDPETKEEINLLQVLSCHGTVDRIVLSGKKKDIRLRLLATPISEELANIRRMKAKKQAKTYTPSQELLQLMSWSIFLVTIESPVITVIHVMRLYRLRWRIENIFKTWKSYFCFDQLHHVSERQLSVLLTARLIIISLSYYGAYTPLYNAILLGINKQLSLMKFMRYVQKNLAQLPQMLNPQQWTPVFLDAIGYYCSYDNRRRDHFIDNLTSILAELEILQPLA